MADEWQTTLLDDLCDEITVGHVGPMANEYVSDGIPFLRSLNVDVLRITTATFRSTIVLLPDCIATRAFNDEVSALFKLLLANLKESVALAQVRDTLLPKLISGEVAVPAVN